MLPLLLTSKVINEIQLWGDSVLYDIQKCGMQLTDKRHTV